MPRPMNVDGKPKTIPLPVQSCQTPIDPAYGRILSRAAVTNDSTVDNTNANWLMLEVAAIKMHTGRAAVGTRQKAGTEIKYLYTLGTARSLERTGWERNVD